MRYPGHQAPFPRVAFGIRVATLFFWAVALLAPRQVAAQVAGADVRLGNLRDSFQNAFPGQGPTATGGWTWGASLAVDETYNSATPNTGGTRDVRAKPDFYSSITPSVSVQGEGPRLTGALFYSPQARIYAKSPSQNTIAHSFNGTSHLTVIPDLAFVDMRGNTSLQSRGGGVGPTGTTSLSSQDQIQTTALSVDSYLVHRFDNIGTAQLGYTIGQTIISGSRNQIASPFVTPQSDQSVRSMTPRFSFTTGDDFGRFQGSIQAQATTNAGTGPMAGSSRSSETASGAYMLTRLWTLTGSVGHEKIDYAGLSPIHIDGPTWSGGVTVTPDPASSIAISYGQKSGRPSLFFNASTALTSRIIMSGSYSEILSSSAEAAQAGLANSTVGAGGISINRTTGAPIISSDNFNGTQGAITYSKTVNATVTWLRDRDTVSFSANRLQTQLVSAAVIGGPNATTGFNGTLSWQHEFSENLRGNIFTLMGQRSATSAAGTKTNQNTMSIFGGLTYAISQTLATHLQATFTKMTNPLPTQKPTSTMIVIGLNKMF